MSETKTEGIVVSQQSLYSDEQIKEIVANSEVGFTIQNFITGIAQFCDPNSTGFCGMKGNSSTGWQSFNFKIPIPAENEVTITNAMTSVSLLGISNNQAACGLNYFFRNISSSISTTGVVVTGQVMIGDSDGWLGQLGYTCIVAYGLGT